VRARQDRLPLCGKWFAAGCGGRLRVCGQHPDRPMNRDDCGWAHPVLLPYNRLAGAEIIGDMFTLTHGKHTMGCASSAPRLGWSYGSQSAPSCCARRHYALVHRFMPIPTHPSPAARHRPPRSGHPRHGSRVFCPLSAGCRSSASFGAPDGMRPNPNVASPSKGSSAPAARNPGRFPRAKAGLPLPTDCAMCISSRQARVQTTFPCDMHGGDVLTRD
jgi:hypothetical protein